jgi:hypothetical protein
VSAHTLKVRLRLFWQAVKAARGKADDAELRRQFMARARSSGLVAAVHALSRHGVKTRGIMTPPSIRANVLRSLETFRIRWVTFRAKRDPTLETDFAV